MASGHHFDSVVPASPATVAEEVARHYEGVPTNEKELNIANGGIIPSLLEIASEHIAQCYGDSIDPSDVPEEHRALVERHIPVTLPVQIAVDSIHSNAYWQRRMMHQFPIAARRDCTSSDVDWRRAFLETHLSRTLMGYIPPPALFPGGGVPPPPVPPPAEECPWPDTAPVTRAFTEPGIHAAFIAASDVVRTLKLTSLPSHVDLHCVVSRLPRLETFILSYASRDAEYKRFLSEEPATIARRAAPASLVTSPTRPAPQRILAPTPDEVDLLMTRALEYHVRPTMEVGDAVSLGRALRDGACAALHTLRVVDSGVTGQMAAAVCAGLLATRVRVIDLSLNRLGDEGARAVCKLLRSGSAIETVSLAANQLTSESAQYIANGIRRTSTLRTVDLRTNDLGDLGAATILDAATRRGVGVNTLRLSANGLTGAVASSVGDAIANAEELSVLDLDDNYFGDQGGSSLLTCLRTAVDAGAEIHMDRLGLIGTGMGREVLNAVLVTVGRPPVPEVKATDDEEGDEMGEEG